MEQKAGLVSTNEALEKEVIVSYAVLKMFTHMFTTNLSFFELFLVLVINLCKISSQVVTNDMVTYHAKIRKKQWNTNKHCPSDKLTNAFVMCAFVIINTEA